MQFAILKKSRRMVSDYETFLTSCVQEHCIYADHCRLVRYHKYTCRVQSRGTHRHDVQRLTHVVPIKTHCRCLCVGRNVLIPFRLVAQIDQHSIEFNVFLDQNLEYTGKSASINMLASNSTKYDHMEACQACLEQCTGLEGYFTLHTKTRGKREQ